MLIGTEVMIRACILFHYGLKETIIFCRKQVNTSMLLSSSFVLTENKNLVIYSKICFDLLFHFIIKVIIFPPLGR